MELIPEAVKGQSREKAGELIHEGKGRVQSKRSIWGLCHLYGDY